MTKTTKVWKIRKIQMVPEMDAKLERLANAAGLKVGTYIQEFVRRTKENPKNSGDKNV